jgi:predicted transcriptional regulator
LAAKGFLRETKRGRLNTFGATASREDYITALIMEALADTDDRHAALSRFAETLPVTDRNYFRKMFSRGAS